MGLRILVTQTVGSPAVLSDEARVAMLQTAGRETVKIINARIKAGQAIGGTAFRAYSRGYAHDRQLAGRNAQPDLTMTGQMLRALDILRVNTGRVTVGISGTAQAARYLMAASKKVKNGDRTHRVATKKTASRYSAKPPKRGKGSTPTEIRNAVKAFYTHGKRPFLGLSEEERQQVSTVVSGWLKARL